ncbi:MAG: rRNA maturation RNase YbeY [Rhodoblastus sp.]|nr:MAG: rRNA maturation RNase YbeY [Rhodoblastus sp.]
MSARSPESARSPDAPLVSIAVESPLWGEGDLQGLAEQAVDAALAEAGVATAPGAERAILFCDDDAIRALNRDWRRIDKPTNVLSFPAHDDPGRLARSPTLGDIAVAQETCAREAAEEGKRFDDHVRHLIVHGVLHLLGYDHNDDEEAEAMEATERRALARIGVGDPYAGAQLAADDATAEAAR